MKHQPLNNQNQKEVAELFASVFGVAEGKEEGRLIGELALQLASAIDDDEVICLGTYDGESLIASIFFTRLGFSEAVSVYMLAPVAVSTAYQGKGVGQALINYGLNELKRRSAKIVITYGDPAYYSKVGFEHLPETVIQAPLALSMPIGWQGQSLTEQPIPTINQRPTCVKAFNNPVYW